MQPFELRGDGLLLAVPTRDDIDRITEICRDPENQRWTSVPVPYERSDAEAFVTATVPAGWTSEEVLTWAIRSPEDRGVLGMIDIRLSGSKAGELGFNLAPEARGARVMSRAVRLVADYAFAPEGLGLTHLHWWAYVGNWPSRRVAWACGFRVEGRVRGIRTQRGVSRDSWAATLAADDQRKPATPWLDVPVLRGNGVTLRPFADSDVDSIVAACNDATTRHWLSWLAAPYTAEHAMGFVHGSREDAAAGHGIHWAAATSDDGPAMGSFSLLGLHQHDGGAEVGFWLHPAARGRGVATEATRLLVAHAFAARDDGGLGLRRLVVRHAEGNDASRGVLERVGFRPFGIERASCRIGADVIVDQHWYDLLSDEAR